MLQNGALRWKNFVPDVFHLFYSSRYVSGFDWYELFCLLYIAYLFLDSHMELQIMYAGTKIALQREANLTRSYEVRELDELTEEWLKEQIGQ